ncbi:thrombopoietin isoform X1 [Chelonia mydas]|uniref:thrombopoietin isoform X1 n=1 Tax=Chelonia mydas TaxID=8469 RepID=UPI001CA963D9|nr:thrombopoietin isoform X1 [Chelonia mydas]
MGAQLSLGGVWGGKLGEILGLFPMERAHRSPGWALPSGKSGPCCLSLWLPSGLLLLTAFLLHIKLSRTSPARLVCDNRLIQKYISEAKDMEKRVSQCQELPSLSQPLPLPMVDFSLREWKTKTNETKRQEILGDLALLVDAVTAVQGHVRQECAAALLGQLYKKANSFLLLLQTFSWQVSAWQPDRASRTTLQSHPSVIFLVYRQLVQGKLRFLFHDLAKDFCREGSQRVPEPPSTPCPQLPQGDSESPAS